MSAEDEFEDNGEHHVAKLTLDDNDDEDMAIVKDLQAKVSANPADASLLAEYTRALEAVGMEEEAVKAYDAALKANPNSAALLVGKAHALFVVGNNADGRHALEEALKIEPNNAAALYDLGKSLQGDESHVKARDAFQRALAADAKHGGALFELGSYAMSGGDNKSDSSEAIRLFTACSEVDPNNFACWKNLGQLCQTAGDQARAAAYFSNASKLEPSDVQLRAKVMQCYDAQNMNKEREEFRQKLHDDYKAGVLNKNYTVVGRYNCGQFEVGDKFIMAFDHFPAPNAQAIYTFYIYRKGHVHEDKVLLKITVAHEGGKYVVKGAADKVEASFDAKPEYGAVKDLVLQIAATVA